MTSLKYRVPLYPGEAYRSFASRLGAANGSPALIDFSRDMAIDLAGMRRGEIEAFERLVTLGGVASDALRQAAIVPDYPYSLLGGQRIARAFVNRTRLRVCPSCIRDDIENGSGPPHTRPWLRSAWSVNSGHSPVNMSSTISRSAPEMNSSVPSTGDGGIRCTPPSRSMAYTPNACAGYSAKWG